MFSSTLTIQTDDAARIGKRLFNHWRHKMAVFESNDNHKDALHFPFSDEDMAVFYYDAQGLEVVLTTQTLESEQRLQSVVLNHINRMAGSDFDASWQKAAS